METTTIQNLNQEASQQVKTISAAEVSMLVNNLVNHAETISEATAGFIWNLVGTWFKAYLVSSEFAALSEAKKRECFDQFESLQHMLSLIGDFMHKHELSEESYQIKNENGGADLLFV